MSELRWRRILAVLTAVTLISCLLPFIVRSFLVKNNDRKGSQFTTAEPFSGNLTPNSAPTQASAPLPEDLAELYEPHPTPTTQAGLETYVVQQGDTLATIAAAFQVDPGVLMDYNGLTDPNLLYAGQALSIPPSNPPQGPDLILIPDSELVYGPAVTFFDVADFAAQQGGYLAAYQEDVDGVLLSGPAIVTRIAREYSVNPRLLLAILEYRSGWVTGAHEPDEADLAYPLGWVADPYRSGLYRQLAWTADQLNYGYYTWRAYGVYSWMLADGSVYTIAPTINAGTAGVQYLMGRFHGRDAWGTSLGESGVIAVYRQFFDEPFSYLVDPVVPAGLSQPLMQLPFEPGEKWYFTGGPHGGWGDGSGWAALDFAPPGEPMGCVRSEAWVTAVASGPLVYSENGMVLQDLDGDGFEQTGWVVVYLHIDSHQRTAAGVTLKPGDRLGHPSCEGGYSNGTHVHLARRYNGEWISADGALPFVLDGWVSEGAGVYYDGYLRQNNRVIEAWNGNRSENQIWR
jgi:LasA protease